MSILLPVRFTSGQRGIYTEPTVGAYCGDVLLSDFVYAKTVTTWKNTVSIEMTTDGSILYKGFEIDRQMQCDLNSGSAWEIDDFVYFGSTYPDETQPYDTSGSAGAHGRQNCTGMQVSPGNSPDFMIATHNSTLAGKWCKWDFPTVDWEDNGLAPGLFRAGPGISINGGLILTEQIAANGTGFTRVEAFRIKEDGTVALGMGFTGNPYTSQFDLATPWRLEAPNGLTYTSSGADDLGSHDNFWCDEAGINIFTAEGTTVNQFCTSEAWTANGTTIPVGITAIDSIDLSDTAVLPAGQQPMATIVDVYLSPTKHRLYVLEKGGSVSGKIHQFNGPGV